MRAIAEAHGCSAAQVLLRWHLDNGEIVIPKSVHPERIRQNIAVEGIELSGEEWEDIAGLETGERVGPDPNVFERC